MYREDLTKRLDDQAQMMAALAANNKATKAELQTALAKAAGILEWLSEVGLDKVAKEAAAQATTVRPASSIRNVPAMDILAAKKAKAKELGRALTEAEGKEIARAMMSGNAPAPAKEEEISEERAERTRARIKTNTNPKLATNA